MIFYYYEEKLKRCVWVIRLVNTDDFKVIQGNLSLLNWSDLIQPLADWDDQLLLFLLITVSIKKSYKEKTQQELLKII